MMRYVFGPVRSRRLGRSLGVDLVPFKTCTYDCLYCQLGRTTDKTVERKDWGRCDAVVDEIQQKLGCRPDYITFSGSGEPTLHTGLGTLIERIKAVAKVPVAVLTNGSLLWRADVREELQGADLVIPSLDAGDAALFHHINRPHASISFERLVEGLIAFRQEFRGPYWLEVFLLAGLTSTIEEVKKIAAIAQAIRPDRVQLNTVTRPAAEASAEAVSQDRLVELAALFHPRAEVIVGDVRESVDEGMANSDDILEMIRRRPCTVQDIISALDLHINEVLKYVEALIQEGLIEPAQGREDVYYRAVRPRGDA